MSEEIIKVPLETELDALFGQYTASDQARGLVYGLVCADGLVHSTGFGVANAEGAPPDADTVFPIASMSKSFVAAAALVARDAGLLSLDDPITRFVPEFVVSSSSIFRDGVPTIGMLLSMCGGLTEDNAWVDPFIGMPTQTLLSEVSGGVRLSHYPGATFEYSNLGFSLAGLAVSRAVDRPLEAFVADALFAPLGLGSTTFDSAVPDGVRRATGYSLDAAGDWVPFEPQSSDAFAGAGGIVSTVRDLSRWITWLGSAFRPPRDDDVGALSRTSRRELQRIHISGAPSLSVGAAGALHVTMNGYALGLRVTTDLHRGTIVSHSGGLPGFTLHMTWHPQTGHGVVVLTNSHRGDPVTLCNLALDRVLDRHQAEASTVSMWPETMQLRELADRLVRQWDDELAARILAPNVDFDRPLSERRADIEQRISEVGPLLPPDGRDDIVSTTTPADITWAIPGRNGELVCTIHLTPAGEPRIQQLVVNARLAARPRSAFAVEGLAWPPGSARPCITPAANVRVELPGAVDATGARVRRSHGESGGP